MRAQSGTHSHSRHFSEGWSPRLHYNCIPWLWVPAFAGTTGDWILVPEMPDAREHHGDAVLVGGLDHLVVAHGAARLDHRGGAGLDTGEHAVGKREERI